MQLLALADTGHGYRGCLVDRDHYRFFMVSHNGRVRWFKSYAVADFDDHDHFMALMLKYLLPANIFRPPLPLPALTPAELQRLINS